MTATIQVCPCCEGENITPFHEAGNVPVNSVLALKSKQEALEFPVGDISLSFCEDCGFIYNAAFDPKLLEYSERYDPTQAFSGTFNAWHRQLATDVIERFGLEGKRVIEIGCGKGEFLHLLGEIGNVEGVGFDPSYEPARDATPNERLDFVADFYSEKYSDVKGDAVCCKMTLEHIGPSKEFIETVRRAVGDDPNTVIFFQVPDVVRILEEAAFWDVYYEHCSYFSAGSLAALFQRCGFEVTDVRLEYGDQYLMLVAHPVNDDTPSRPAPYQDVEGLRTRVGQFTERLTNIRESWGARLAGYKAEGKKTVVWGSGSKGVAFLTTIPDHSGIDYVVDINSFRQGHFMARTGQEIVSPEFLEEYKPDVVVIMNPMYRDEIEKDLARLGLHPEVLTA
jgi:SAM-dependent methyltransferase